MVIGPGGAPSGALAEALDRDLCGLDAFGSASARQALALRGSGIARLSPAAPKVDRLEVAARPRNGSTPTTSKPGILVRDLWDHAWAADHPDRAARLDAFRTIVDRRVCESRPLAPREGEQRT